ncbi:MAG: CHASE domain-containing protein [Burkholderiales bacterium]|nr:CHASE domain-containing protein [Burkholderiales bacterium]
MEQAKRKKKIANLFTARNSFPLVLLLLSLFVTYKAWQGAQRVADRTIATAFDFRVRELSGLIAQRMQVYEQVLRGGVGLFAASTQITRQDFHVYIRALALHRDYPGIQGVGFSVLVPSAKRVAHIRSVKREGFPEYTLWPDGARDFYTSIVYLEPFSGRNLRAFGYDMYSDPVRRAAMDFARDTGKAAMSGKTELVQETSKDVQAGFLLYLPVYRGGKTPETIEERRANLVGWVYAPFRGKDLMHRIQNGYAEDIDLEIYDGGEIRRDALMYDSSSYADENDKRNWLKKIEPIEIAQHQWTAVMTALPTFENRLEQGRPALILRSGISISLLLALLAWVFLDDRARAIQAAHQATQLALYDPLTGLPNRKLIADRLHQAVVMAKREQERLAVLFIDLDKFKPVNDELGHAVGDLLLKEVANRLQACVREADTVARLGGDEFVALLVHAHDRHSAEVAAEKMLHALMRPFEVVGHRLQIGGSIGVALYPEDGQEPNSLVKSADAAMYAAKNAGRSTVRFASDLS